LRKKIRSPAAKGIKKNSGKRGKLRINIGRGKSSVHCLRQLMGKKRLSLRREGSKERVSSKKKGKRVSEKGLSSVSLRH